MSQIIAGPQLRTVALATHPRVGEHSMLRFLGSDVLEIIAGHIKDNAEQDYLRAVSLAEKFLLVMVYQNLCQPDSMHEEVALSVPAKRWFLAKWNVDTANMTDREVNDAFFDGPRDRICREFLREERNCCRCVICAPYLPGKKLVVSTTYRLRQLVPDFEGVAEYFAELSKDESEFIAIWRATMPADYVIPVRALSFSLLHVYPVKYMSLWRVSTECEAPDAVVFWKHLAGKKYSSANDYYDSWGLTDYLTK
jgi:hypothetical protein